MPDGEFDWGGRLRKGIGGAQRFPQDGRKPSRECKGRRELDCDNRRVEQVRKVGLSDPVVLRWECHRSTDKSYPGDNRLITPKSSHRRSGLAPRCRLIASWGCSRVPRVGLFAPLKRYASWVQNVVRQFGPYPARGAGYLRGAVLSTRGPGWTGRWCTG